MNTSKSLTKKSTKPHRQGRARKRRAKERERVVPRNPKAGAVKQELSLREQMRAKAKHASPGHLTVEAKQSKVGLLANYITLNFPDVVTMAMVQVIMIVAFMDSRKEDDLADRTLQNDISAIRTTFRHAGYPGIADAPELTCEALGIDDASRAGTKMAASVMRYELAVIIARLISPGLAVCLMLQWTLGLRAMEAIRSSGSLAGWLQQLNLQQPLRVIDGTKGGRKRFVNVVDVKAAKEAIEEGLEVMAANGGVLIPGGLKQAYSYYAHTMNRKIKLQGHSLRYAFTYHRVVAYLAMSCSFKEALGRTAKDLGHGEGRAVWVRHVYLNGIELGPLKEAAKAVAQAKAPMRE